MINYLAEFVRNERVHLEAITGYMDTLISVNSESGIKRIESLVIKAGENYKQRKQLIERLSN